MKLTKEIFDTFDGKAGNHFEEMEVSTYAEIGTRERKRICKTTV